MTDHEATQQCLVKSEFADLISSHLAFTMCQVLLNVFYRYYLVLSS